MHLIPFPAHREHVYYEGSVPSSRTDAFEAALRRQLEAEFPGEQFRLYPDWNHENTMIIVVPPVRTGESAPRPAIAVERRVRTIIDRVLRNGDWATLEH